MQADTALLPLPSNLIAEKLKQFILTLNSVEWDTDYGITYKGEPVTIKNSIDMLIYDYDTHRQQIIEWVKSIQDLNTKGG